MKKYVFALFSVLVLWSCNQQRSEQNANSREEVAGLAVTDTTVSSVTGVEPKIVKTADMRFEVKNARKAKRDIETLTKGYGGLVTQSSWQHTVNEVRERELSADSILKIVKYSATVQMTVSVPSERMEEFLDKISALTSFVDMQNVSLDDQSLTYLANKLKSQLIQRSAQSSSKRMSEIAKSVELQENAIDQRIHNFSIDDQVKYSTLVLSFYQDRMLSKQTVANDNLDNFGPGFFKRLGENLGYGWELLLDVILALASVWFVWVILIPGVWLYLRYKRRRISVAVRN